MDEKRTDGLPDDVDGFISNFTNGHIKKFSLVDPDTKMVLIGQAYRNKRICELPYKHLLFLKSFDPKVSRSNELYRLSAMVELYRRRLKDAAAGWRNPPFKARRVKQWRRNFEWMLETITHVVTGIDTGEAADASDRLTHVVQFGNMVLEALIDWKNQAKHGRRRSDPVTDPLPTEEESGDEFLQAWSWDAFDAELKRVASKARNLLWMHRVIQKLFWQAHVAWSDGNKAQFASYMRQGSRAHYMMFERLKEHYAAIVKGEDYENLPGYPSEYVTPAEFVAPTEAELKDAIQAGEFGPAPGPPTQTPPPTPATGGHSFDFSEPLPEEYN